MSLYKSVFKDSLKLTWRNKYFWLLGLFTIFFSTSVEIDMFDNFFGPNRNNFYNYKTILENGLVRGGFFNGLKNWLQTDPGSFYQMARLGLIFLLVLVALLLISAIAQIIITSHSASFIKLNVNNLKNPKKFGLLDNLKKMKGLIWPVSATNLALKLLVNIALILVSLPLLMNKAGAINWWYIILFILLFPAAIVLAFIARYVTSYIIIQGQGFRRALANGWFLFKNNWLISVEMSLMLFLLNIFGSLAVIFIILAIANPLWFIGIIVNQYVYKGGFYIVLAISYVLFFCLFAWGASLLSVFNITSWTGLFLKLDKSGGESKLMRLFSDLTNK